MSESVYEIYKNKAPRARADADRRSAEAWARDSRIEEIDKELSETGMRIFAAALSGEENRDRAYKNLEARVSALRAEKQERLTALGLPADYTDIKYECEKCSDTGYEGFRMCECMKRAFVRYNYEQSGIGKYLENQSFDSFDVNLYPQNARANMTKVFERARRYAEGFSTTTSESLLFIGATGLGKTHLSSSVAKAVIEKGFSVIYDCAQNIISAFERDRFKEGDRLNSDKYIDADLLVIDDLGAEIQSRSSVSYFYTIINTRMIAAKPTIVSTNLTYRELSLVYDSRIVSRLFGEYTVLPFEGDDVRKAKRS